MIKIIVLGGNSTAGDDLLYWTQTLTRYYVEDFDPVSRMPKIQPPFGGPIRKRGKGNKYKKK
jgi:hypothetical protein